MASPTSKPRAPPALSTLAILDRTHISTRIAAGQLLVLHPPYVYRIPPAWLALHPGGDMAILHYVGRDATNEIEAYHTDATMRDRMSRWIVGRVELDADGWRDMVPPVQLSMWPLPVPKILVELVGDEKVDVAKEVEVGITLLTREMVDPPSAPLDQLPLTPSYQHHLRQSQRVLQARIKALGLDTPPPFLAGYGPSLLIYSSLLAAFIYLYRQAEGTLGYIAAAVALGAWWHQITFVAHDAGHTALTGDWWTDRVLGIAIANFMGGISIGWWADNHNVHHLVTNSPEHDPDIQHLPFFAISPKFFGGLRSTYYNRIMEFDGFAKAVLPYQHNLYYIIMCFARFNLFANSYAFMLNKWPARASPLFNLRLAEFFGIAFFWSWFGLVVKGVEGTGNKVLFVLVSFAVTSPLHVQIVLSHFSRPISITSDLVPHSELLEAHAHRQLRTTMDIACPTYLDFLHGGLNFQLPHHLLPRLPRFRFRQVALEVEKWVREEQALVEKGWNGQPLKKAEGLVYLKMEFVEANRSVLGVLKSVGQQVKFLSVVAEAQAKGEIEDH